MAKTVKTLPRWLKIENDKFYLSSEKTADFFGVSIRTLLNWDEKAAGSLKNSYGFWDLKAIMEWRSDGKVSDASRKAKAEADLKEEQALAKKFENEVERGQYMAKAEIENEWARRVVEIKASLLALTRKIAAGFSDPNIRIDVEKKIGDEIYIMLEQYSREGQYTPSTKKKRAKRVS
jgi:hypothetical protein